MRANIDVPVTRPKAQSAQRPPERASKAERFTLMDQVHASTFRTKLHGSRINDRTKRVLMQYRIMLRRAERFALSNDAIEVINDIHTQDSQTFESSCLLARLPFSPMWIEYDNYFWIKDLHSRGRMPITRLLNVIRT